MDLAPEEAFLALMKPWFPGKIPVLALEEIASRFHRDDNDYCYLTYEDRQEIDKNPERAAIMQLMKRQLNDFRLPFKLHFGSPKVTERMKIALERREAERETFPDRFYIPQDSALWETRIGKLASVPRPAATLDVNRCIRCLAYYQILMDSTDVPFSFVVPNSPKWPAELHGYAIGREFYNLQAGRVPLPLRLARALEQMAFPLTLLPKPQSQDAQSS
ncbi:hypothetical protein SPRG_12253 [Saprolegnia parasitica CBS 223.65]|uniref:Uncharacterized protein n=1 Tax=Saprolegnia parasitica (strain CBS 223.65) TaxID=695850 RepID=A0A067BU34_SAPPC|nr:hypothetical protein SPRG_12253 [Saprolegnia parasitica CBS 223.65]KDO22044.1 hypothetical protein SPRG_12253 [Saprolegnia parasitica CBS 223.65]|eukprot:XP_012207287.1 hypothetical protein SPRG_12253 [Saprolegnia parasitica CBS 223.65]